MTLSYHKIIWTTYKKEYEFHIEILDHACCKYLKFHAREKMERRNKMMRDNQ